MLDNYYHHPVMRRLRSAARGLGILKVIKPIVAKRQNRHEEAFSNALMKAVASGDCVWDIGAHVGVYTKQFQEWVGPSGTVVAFEPFPKAFLELEKNVQAVADGAPVQLFRIALSDKAGDCFFNGDLEDGITMNAHLSDTDESKNGIKVRVSTVDIVKNEGVPPPNAAKIDVEGFEEDVLRGGEQTFRDPDCRHLLIEMHFTRMDERNLGDSASRIVSMLTDWGYKIKWVDASHLHAFRAP
jgi:FkbM family methyltransferase